LGELRIDFIPLKFACIADGMKHLFSDMCSTFHFAVETTGHGEEDVDRESEKIYHFVNFTSIRRLSFDGKLNLINYRIVL
jgi:hypothetical protein